MTVSLWLAVVAADATVSSGRLLSRCVTARRRLISRFSIQVVSTAVAGGTARAAITVFYYLAVAAGFDHADTDVRAVGIAHVAIEDLHACRRRY